jgi:hypothetical protein
MPVPWSRLDPARHGPAMVAAVLAATAVVGLGTGLLVGSASGDDPVTATSGSPAPSTSSPAPVTSPSASPTTRSASEIERGVRQDVGYFVGARDEGDGTHVTFDRVLLKIGRDARTYAKQHHKPPPGPDGVLLVNDNPLTRDLVLAPDVRVIGTTALARSSTATDVPLTTLLDAVATDGAHLLLDLRYDDLGYVVEVREHDLP